MMKNNITLLQLENVLPMVEYGIWLRINGQANYITNNDVWNLLLKKYGNYLVDGIKPDGPLNDGGDPHLVITIEPGMGENTDKKLEEAGW